MGVSVAVATHTKNGISSSRIDELTTTASKPTKEAVGRWWSLQKAKCLEGRWRHTDATVSLYEV